MTVAFVFPGQGSQSVGMMADLAEGYSLVKDVFAEASGVLGFDLWKMIQDGPAEDLNQTHNTQPAMLAAGIAAYRVWQAKGGAEPVMMAGHSLGEYTALVASGAMSFADGIRLVAERGRLMQSAVPAGTGAMAAILGLDDDVVRAVCAEAAQGEVVQAVNFNSPGQVVIAGQKAAVGRAMALASEKGAKRALELPVSVPSHCDLMKDAADKLAAELDSIEIKMPSLPVVMNVSAKPAESVAEIRDSLKKQLYSPVLWVDSVLYMKSQGVDMLMEMGPGKVLAGLAKRIDKDVNALPVFDQASLDKALA